MADMWMNVDATLSEVPVNLMPLIDSTDFVTVEDAVAYNAAGMDLRWNFVTTAGAYTSTAVTPTTGGDYDWTHQGDGMYTIEIPASGGASINNSEEGFGWFTGKITGVLPFRGPVIGFRAAALNDALIDGGDNLDVNVTQIEGDSQSATDLKDFADAGYDPSTNKVQGVVLVDTATTVTNRVTANADQVDGSAPAAASLKNMALVLATGAVVDDASNTATTFKTDLTETADDYYGDADGGNVLAFVSGTTNATQTRRITAYNGTTKFVTVESAFDAEPAADDAFILLGRIEN